MTILVIQTSYQTLEILAISVSEFY